MIAEGRKGEDAAKHESLVAELVKLFENEGYTITGADGVQGYYPPVELTNDGYGDQEDKAPDVYAYDPKEQRYVIGEAKTGLNDIETDHALTQWNVYLDQFHRKTGKPSLLYVILPSLRVPTFQALITHYVHREYWHKVIVVSSSKWTD